MTPHLKTLQFSSAWHAEFFSQLDFICFLIDLVKTLWANFSCMCYSGELFTEVVSLFAWEWWATFYLGIQVSSQNNFYFSADHHGFWLRLWQLNPVLQEVVCHPEHVSVSTLSSLFLESIGWLLFLEVKLSLCHPVIVLASVNLSEESEASGSTHGCQSLQ